MSVRGACTRMLDPKWCVETAGMPVIRTPDVGGTIERSWGFYNFGRDRTALPCAQRAM